MSKFDERTAVTDFQFPVYIFPVGGNSCYTDKQHISNFFTCKSFNN